MINVPARVKDALRSGEYRKNYKITVSEIAPAQAVVSEFSLYEYDPKEYSRRNVDLNITSTEDKYYLRTNHPFDELHITYQYQGESYTEHYYNYTQEGDIYYVEFRVRDVVETATRILIKNNNIASWDEYECDILHKYLADATIDNNNLVSESVKFDERMCSDTELKFGLCEGTSVEFQYFDFPSILGKHLNIELDAQYKKADGTLDWYTIPMGQFDVDEISRQASTGIIKASAYNKLMSKYLDANCASRITEIISQTAGGAASVADILDTLLNDYTIPTTSYVELDGGYIYSPTINYTTDSGIRIYYVDGLPYDPPSSPVVNQQVIGKYFGIYTVEFYYIPIGETSSQTNDTYYYDIDFSAIWNIIGSKYNTAWQYVTGPFRGTYEVFNPYSVYEDGAETPYPAVKDSLYVGNITVNSGQSVIYLRDHQTGRASTPLFTGYYPKITVAVLVECDFTNGTETAPSSSSISDKITEKAQQLIEQLRGVQLAKIYRYEGSPINSRNITVDDLDQEVTLRDLQSASFEVCCQYGKLDRVTDIFAGIELNNGELYPRDNLYPADDLLPMGNSEGGYPSMYSKLWADEGNVRSFKYLIITYKTTETIDGQTQEVEKTLQRTVNANGTDNYNMSDNWLFRNLIWTSQQVGAYADAMVLKMQNIRWFPFEMWCAGLPYLEAGDQIEIAMKEGTYKSYVLRRTLSGIQNLQDELIDGTLDIF